jgi:hypothetical protein
VIFFAWQAHHRNMVSTARRAVQLRQTQVAAVKFENLVKLVGGAGDIRTSTAGGLSGHTPSEISIIAMLKPQSLLMSTVPEHMPFSP